MQEPLKTLEVEVELTNCCNANCVTCPRNEMVEANGFMDIGTFVRIIDKYKEDQKPSITLAGLGEPLLNKDILKIVRLASERGFNVDLITNGMLLNSHIQSKLISSGIRGVYCSFYGITKYSVEKSMDIDYEITFNNIINFSKLAKRNNVKFKIFWIKTEFVSESKEEIFEFWQNYDIEVDSEFEPWNRSGLYIDSKFNDLEKFPLPDFDQEYWCNLLQNTDTYDCYGNQVLCCNDLFKKENKFESFNSDYKVNNRINKMKFLHHKPLLCRRCQKPFLDYNWTLFER